jgi:hypothetical protein
MGDYGWSEFGSDVEDSPTPTNFWTTTALVHFDGNGNFSLSNTWEVDDGVSSGPFTGAGTYTVNPNCTMTITYTQESETYNDNGVIVGAVGEEVITSEYGPASGEYQTTGHVDMKKIGVLD